MNREYYKWFSSALGKDMEMLVFGHAGDAIIFFPTRTAHFYDYENWGIIDAIKDKIEQGLFQVYCVDSIDAESFYASIHPSDKIKRHLQYEDYILNEVLPLIRNKNSVSNIITAGCSLGGYHAVNIAFKYPQFFNKVIGMSSRYDLTLSTELFPNLFDGYFDEDIYFNMPTRYVANLTDPEVLKKLRKLTINIIIGKEDPFFENNQQLSSSLTAKEISHHLHVWDDEAHRPRHWRQMVQVYL
jgi:esterase/lipase superfamily enzyme